MANLELKQPIVEEIKAQLDGAKSLVVVDYRGITVADVTELRKQCREAGVFYKVYKNTMVKRAVEGTEFESIVKDLEGTNAFAISKDDATLAARTISTFSKKAKVCKLKCGVVEGTYYDDKGIETIATIPSREELLAKFLGSIQSPIANFARVIKQIAEKDGETAQPAEAAEAAAE
ncbi:MAG: 50S ribosomal protein L10 [Clostridiales bacterium]|nr:50S ribosomal protein L10 [Clostridiales bacterium]